MLVGCAALAGGGMEDHPEVSAALVDVRLVIAEGTEPVSGLAVAQVAAVYRKLVANLLGWLVSSDAPTR